jgi:hypothetical protein
MTAQPRRPDRTAPAFTAHARRLARRRALARAAERLDGLALILEATRKRPRPSPAGTSPPRSGKREGLNYTAARRVIELPAGRRRNVVRAP